LIKMPGTGQMNNQWMIGRPALGGKYSGNCRRVGGIGPEAVNRLGRKSDQFARLQQGDGASEFGMH
jgi:hypothetical protein